MDSTAEPLRIPSETKNWTWVLGQPCPECGFDAVHVAFRDVPELTRRNVVAWGPVLSRPSVGQRPAKLVWSPLEYACHVRDVFRTMNYRLGLMLTRDDPLFPNWDQDVTAVEDRYWAQDPSTVLAELTEAGHTIADSFEAVPDESIDRTGRRSDGAVFTVGSLARYFVHDPTHHLWDVTSGKPRP
ncbi:DinB family protein [Brooklawnia cerclae]|uniref:DinB-like domain-containing protein n=1 Tax=Brooklawnia cerclae TaxID=349934 RepID=A0ABX0SJD1_9ACTN|nr:DinB family protein [Brooklawnia cerclae]NIH57165.1 hypothetical protein [Brooklawnia cerclae]